MNGIFTKVDSRNCKELEDGFLDGSLRKAGSGGKHVFEGGVNSIEGGIRVDTQSGFTSTESSERRIHADGIFLKVDSRGGHLFEGGFTWMASF